MTNYSLNQIIRIFQTFAEASGGTINSFYCGSPEDYKNPNRLYPLLYIEPQSIEYLTNQVIYEIEVTILDRVEKGNPKQQNEVFSDTNRIMGDIKAYLTNSFQYDFIVEPVAKLEPVGKDFSSDVLSGWRTVLNIKSPWDANICQIPGVITPLAYSNGLIEITRPNYLTCETLTACTSFQNYVATYGGGSSSLTFSAGTNLVVVTGGTYPNITYRLADTVNVSTLNAHEVNIDIINTTELNNSGVSTLSEIQADIIQASEQIYAPIVQSENFIGGVIYSTTASTDVLSAVTAFISTARTSILSALTIYVANDIYSANAVINDISSENGLIVSSSGRVAVGDTEIYSNEIITPEVSADYLSASRLIFLSGYSISALFSSTGQTLTKVNRSGDTMTGSLLAPLISANTISASSINNTSQGGAGSGINIKSTTGSSYATMDWYNDVNDNAQMLMAGSSFSSGIFNSRSASFNTGGQGGLNLVAYHASGGNIRFATGGVAAANERMRIEAGGLVRAASLSATTFSATTAQTTQFIVKDGAWVDGTLTVNENLVVVDTATLNTIFITGGVYSGASQTSIEDILASKSDFRASAATAAMFTGSPRKATITFSSTMGTTNYAISVIGEDDRNFFIESKSATGFVINAGSAVALTGNTYWTAQKYR